MTISDLSLLLRQNFYLDLVIPKSLDILEKNPLIGESWDGEMLWSLSCAKKEFSEEEKERIRKICANIKTSKSRISKDEKEWLNTTLEEFKKSVLSNRIRIC